MMRRFTSVLLVLAMCLTFAACGCRHEWLAATCDTPKTCELCGETDGEANGHSIVAASCAAPEHCENCNYEYGEKLEHIWVDATTEAPKTCDSCGLTEGERIITDPRFTTAATKDLYGTWAMEMSMGGEMMGIPDFTGELAINFVMAFHNDGNMDVTVDVGESFVQSVVSYTVEQMYAEFAAQGLDQIAADEMFATTYSMSIEQYVEEQMAAIDYNALFKAIFEAAGMGGVYYVEGDQLYSAQNWDAEMEGITFALEGDTLTLYSLETALGTDCVFARVSE